MSKFYSFNLSVGGDFPLEINLKNLEQRLKEEIDSDFFLESYVYEDVVSIFLEFRHPIEYAYDEFFWLEYQRWFVERLEKNLATFNQFGFNDFTLWMNFYTVIADKNEGFPQCSFQVLDKDLSTRLFKHGVNAPFDVFVIDKLTAANWLKIPLDDPFFNHL